MKNFKRVFSWIIVSLFIQFSGYYYINNYLLSTETSVKIKKVEKNMVDKIPDAEIQISEGAEDIKVSYDGKYTAYYENDILKVVNNHTGEKEEVEFDEGVEVSFYKWLSGKNRMLIAEKYLGNDESSNFKLSYYDVDKNTKDEVKELTWGNEQSEVKDIQASIFTNAIYIKVAHSSTRSKIYWINIMKDMKRVYTNSYNIGQIEELMNEDLLLYEDLNYNRIYCTDGRGSIRIKGVDDLCLLSVDDNDNVYVGELQEDKVTKIFYGNLKDETDKWKSIDLKGSFDKENIYVLGNGKVYINNELKGSIKELGTGKETVYPGKFLQIYDDGVASVSYGKLKKTQFK